MLTGTKTEIRTVPCFALLKGANRDSDGPDPADCRVSSERVIQFYAPWASFMVPGVEDRYCLKGGWTCIHSQLEPLLVHAPSTNSL